MAAPYWQRPSRFKAGLPENGADYERDRGGFLVKATLRMANRACLWPARCDPKFKTSQDLPDFHYVRYAESLGLKGILVDNPNSIGRAWDEALAADRPVVIDAITDPDVPPLRPHITFEQAKSYAAARLRGDPSGPGIVRQTIRDVMETVLPHRN